MPAILADQILRLLLAAAACALSGDNAISEEEDLSAMNVGRHMWRLSIEAAAEKVTPQARRIGLRADLVVPARERRLRGKSCKPPKKSDNVRKNSMIGVKSGGSAGCRNRVRIKEA